MPQVGANGVTYSGTPELMADYARLARGCRGADHRRLLRHAARACAGDAPRAGEPHARRTADASNRSSPTVGALASPPANKDGGARAAPGDGGDERAARPRPRLRGAGARNSVPAAAGAVPDGRRCTACRRRCTTGRERIAPALRAALAERAGGYDRVLVGYGDCGTGGELDKVVAEFGAERLPGPHCYAFFSGVAEFAARGDADMRSFFLTDFLARHFETLVWEGLGLDRHPELRDAYFGSYESVVFLAQTEDAALTAAAQAAAGRLGLAFERRFVGYGDLAPALRPLAMG